MPISMPVPQDPSAVLDYRIKWIDWLAGDRIVASTWVTSDPLFVVENHSFTDTETTVWCRGGTHGFAYFITNKIVTEQGRTDERTLKIKVKDS